MEPQENNKWKVIAIIFLVLFIGTFIWNLDNKEDYPKPEKRAMLSAIEIGTYENLYDSSELFFDYRVDNYGNMEAKNVKVSCKILDKDSNVKTSVLDNVGNVASSSYKLGQVTTSNIPFSSYENGTIFCYVESCDNCEILSKRIPELRKFYEGN